MKKTYKKPAPKAVDKKFKSVKPVKETNKKLNLKDLAIRGLI